jgi:alpha-galactosidase
MTSTQALSQFSMWAMVAAPLILGSDPRSLSSTTINMLKNPRVVAIDQDSLGAQGLLVSQTSTGQQVWVKHLASGVRAVALFNRGSSPQQITTSASAIGLPRVSRYTLLNAWTNQTSTSRDKISAFVQPDAVVLYRVTADPGCTVPRLFGKTLQAARASLKTARCRLGRVTRRRARNARRGRVIAQSPPAGSHRRRGAKVKAVLAS